MADTEMVYVTKYALTYGIHEVRIRPDEDGWAWASFGYGTVQIGPKDYRRTVSEAKSRADEMRKAKIVSHRKSIAKLEKMKFEDPAS